MAKIYKETELVKLTIESQTDVQIYYNRAQWNQMRLEEGIKATDLIFNYRHQKLIHSFCNRILEL